MEHISSHLAPFFHGFLADTPQNNPSDVEYFPSVLQKGKLNPGGFTWFAQGQTAFAPNSLPGVLDQISIIRALPGGKSGLEAQGILLPVLGEKREQPSGTLGKMEMQFHLSHAIPCGGGRGTLLMARSSQKQEDSWFEKAELC